MAKSAGEMRGAVKAAVLRDLLYGEVAREQQALGLPQPILQQIFMRRAADIALEAADKMRLAHAAAVGQLVERNVLGVAVMDIRQRRSEKLARHGRAASLGGQSAENAVDGDGNLVLAHGNELRGKRAVLRRVRDRAEMVLERERRLFFVDDAEALVQIFGIFPAACAVEVEPVEIHLVRTPVGVRLPAVEQRDLVLVRLGAHAVRLNAQRTAVDVNQEILVEIVALNAVIAVADELTELRAVIQRTFRKFGRQ